MDETKPANERGDDLLSLDEAAPFLGVSKPTLYRLLRQNDIRGLKAGRQWRFRRGDLIAYLEHGTLANTDAPTHELDAELDFLGDLLRRAGRQLPSADLEDSASREAKVKQLAIAIVLHAITERASDIHIEPIQENGETCLLLRIRIDGVLHEVRKMPIRLAGALVQRFKVMADMDRTERTLPQTGRIPIRHDDKDFEARVATVVTLWGEALTMRILDRSTVLLGLDKLGLTPGDRERLRGLIRQPNGLLLVVGPAGSGKTTLLYSCLQEVAAPDRKTLTIEDPIEVSLANVTQIALNRPANLDYAAALRVVLRHDPDILFVADLPNAETVRVAQEAALTGHLVFAGLLTISASSAIVRLADMGIEPHLTAATLIAVVAVRLARRICPNCREAYTADAARLRRFGFAAADLPSDEVTLYRGRGCAECRNRGFKGRVGLFEVMPFSEALADAVIRSAPADEIQAIAEEQGMRTLREDGLAKALEGVTTPDEVMRVLMVSL